jgi:hypothetical protein
VPPFAIAIVVPFHVPVVIVPTCVNDEVTTVAFNAVPDNVPAGATIAVLQLNPVPDVHINALAVVEHDGTVSPLGATAVSDPKIWFAPRAFNAVSGILVKLAPDPAKVVAVTVPATCNGVVGVVVPIPTPVPTSTKMPVPSVVPFGVQRAT